MAVVLDLADIQGNILTAYGKQGFPKGRFITLHIDDAKSGRTFVSALMPMITTALRWPAVRSHSPTGKQAVERPEVAINIAFTWYGLLALQVPIRTLRGMPDEFIEGMMNRAPMLGDNFNGRDPNKAWDEVWTAPKTSRTVDPNTIHILIMMNAQMKDDGNPVDELETKTKQIEALCATIQEACESCRVTIRTDAGSPSRIKSSTAILTHEKRQSRAAADRAFRLYGRHRGSGILRAVSGTARREGGGRQRRRRWRRQLAAAGHRRVSAGLSRRGAGNSRLGHADRVQPQRHFHGLSKAASKRRRSSAALSRKPPSSSAPFSASTIPTRRAKR